MTSADLAKARDSYASSSSAESSRREDSKERHLLRGRGTVDDIELSSRREQGTDEAIPEDSLMSMSIPEDSELGGGVTLAAALQAMT